MAGLLEKKSFFFSLLPELHGSVSDSHHGSFLWGSNGCQGSQQRGEIQVKGSDLIPFRISVCFFVFFISVELLVQVWRCVGRLDVPSRG